MSISIPAAPAAQQADASAQAQAAPAAVPEPAPSSAGGLAPSFIAQMLGLENIAEPAQQEADADAEAPAAEAAIDELPGMMPPAVLPLMVRFDDLQHAAVASAPEGDDAALGEVPQSALPAALLNGQAKPRGDGMLPRALAVTEMQQIALPPAMEAIGSRQQAPRSAGTAPAGEAKGQSAAITDYVAAAVDARETTDSPAPRNFGELQQAQPAAPAASGQSVLKLPASAPEQWRQPLLDALGDRIQTQVGSRGENAVIRLEPPMLGRIDISIRHEGGVLQVQMSATHGEVVRQLHTISDSLRQDLAGRQYADVSVNVSGGEADGRRQQRQEQKQAEAATPGRALGDAEETAVFGLSSKQT